MSTSASALDPVTRHLTTAAVRAWRLHVKKTTIIVTHDLTSITLKHERLKGSLRIWRRPTGSGIRCCANVATSRTIQDQVPPLLTESLVLNRATDFESGASGRPRRPSSMSSPISSPPTMCLRRSSYNFADNGHHAFIHLILHSDYSTPTDG